MSDILRMTCGEEFHVNTNSSCVPARFPARYTARPVVSICLPSQCLLTCPVMVAHFAAQKKTFTPIRQIRILYT